MFKISSASFHCAQKYILEGQYQAKAPQIDTRHKCDTTIIKIVWFGFPYYRDSF